MEWYEVAACVLCLGAVVRMSVRALRRYPEDRVSEMVRLDEYEADEDAAEHDAFDWADVHGGDGEK